MRKRLIFACIALFGRQAVLCAGDLPATVNDLLLENDLPGLQALAESHGGWPSLLDAYPEMLYYALVRYDPYWNEIGSDTLSFLLDNGADRMPYPGSEGSYLHLILEQAANDGDGY